MAMQFISISNAETGANYHVAKVPQINGLFTVLKRVQQQSVDRLINLTPDEADLHMRMFVMLAGQGRIVWEEDDTKYRPELAADLAQVRENVKRVL